MSCVRSALPSRIARASSLPASRARLIAVLGCVAVAGSPVAPCRAATAGAPLPLERFPVCEASAALAMPCTGDPARRCVWVGDNEVHGALFQYRIAAGGRLEPAEPFALPFAGGVAVGDVESLARSGGDVLVVGSHSRKRSCLPSAKRFAVARVGHAPGQAALEATLVATAEGFRERLSSCATELLAIGDEHPGAAALRDAFCAALARSERADDAALRGEEPCREQSFNIEGAATVPGGDGATRLWVGLRAPLLDDGRAVLLRVAPLATPPRSLSFDAIATIDLGGLGVRELAVSDGWLYGIAGCAGRCAAANRLWRAPLSDLHPGATITKAATLASDLSPSAEGLVVQPEEHRALVVIDGDRGDKKSGTTCLVGSSQQVVPLP